MPHKMDCYPWAVPSEDQKRMFDALSYDEQLEMVRAALIEGEKSGISNTSPQELMAETKERYRQEQREEDMTAIEAMKNGDFIAQDEMFEKLDEMAEKAKHLSKKSN